MPDDILTVKARWLLKSIKWKESNLIPQLLILCFAPNYRTSDACFARKINFVELTFYEISRIRIIIFKDEIQFKNN